MYALVYIVDAHIDCKPSVRSDNTVDLSVLPINFFNFHFLFNTCFGRESIFIKEHSSYRKFGSTIDGMKVRVQSRDKSLR